jgi:putative flippase GtrA
VRLEINFDLFEFSKYLVVGALSSGVDLVVFYIFLQTSISLQYVISLSFFSGLTVNYLLHSIYTFNAIFNFGTTCKFLVVVLINYLLSLFVVNIFIICGASPLYGKIISLPIVAANGFFLSKIWVFKFKRPQEIKD